MANTDACRVAWWGLACDSLYPVAASESIYMVLVGVAGLEWGPASNK